MSPKGFFQYDSSVSGNAPVTHKEQIPAGTGTEQKMENHDDGPHSHLR